MKYFSTIKDLFTMWASGPSLSSINKKGYILQPSYKETKFYKRNLLSCIIRRKSPRTSWIKWF